MDKLIIVPLKELNGMAKRAALFWLGWLVALICIITLIIVVRDYTEQIKELRQIQNRQVELDISQQQTTIAFIQAWESQQDAIKLVMAWGKYIQDRDTLSKTNSKEPKLIPTAAISIGAKNGN